MKITVGVIYGGESVEHEVSIISALQAMHALDKERYDVVPLYVSKNRCLYSGELLLEATAYKNMDLLFQQLQPVFLYYDGKKTWMRSLKQSLFKKEKETAIDVILPVIHGTNGEDGTVQGYLEMLKVPYSGCDVIAAGVGQDKVIMKYVMAGAGLPVCPWFWLYGHEYAEKEASIKAQANELGYPLIIKPACLGSSVGIAIAHNEAELAEGITEATRYDRKIVVEKIITNLTEINCSVLGDCYDAQASVLEQVMKQEEILSYQDKYGANSSSKSKGMASTSRLVPAPLSAEKTAEIRQLAIDTFKVLGSSGVCRVDFLMDSVTEKVYVNEINTIPGSLAFYLWNESGVDFTALMNRLVKQAVDRQRQREKMIYSYDTNILSGYASGVKGNKAKG